MSDVIREAAKRHMRDIIRDISEDCYCAGWLDDLEFNLWLLIHHEPDEGYGMCDRQDLADRLALLDTLSRELGGWWHWGGEQRECWIPLDEWEAKFAVYKADYDAKYGGKK